MRGVIHLTLLTPERLLLATLGDCHHVVLPGGSRVTYGRATIGILRSQIATLNTMPFMGTLSASFRRRSYLTLKGNGLPARHLLGLPSCALPPMSSVPFMLDLWKQAARLASQLLPLLPLAISNLRPGMSLPVAAPLGGPLFNILLLNLPPSPLRRQLRSPQPPSFHQRGEVGQWPLKLLVVALRHRLQLSLVLAQYMLYMRKLHLLILGTSSELPLAGSP